MDLGKLLVALGLVLVVVGALVMLAGRAHLPIGRLPGDMVFRGRNTTFYFPLATCIVVSILLSLVLWIVSKFGR